MRSEREVLQATLAMALSEGLIAGDLATGRLMSPNETRSALRGRTGPEAGFGGWWLCTEVHPEMHATCRATPAGSVINESDVQLGIGAGCLVVRHKVGAWQHRFCVPLVGHTIADWLGSIRRGQQLQVSLSSPDSEVAFVSRFEVPAELASRLPHPPLVLPTDLDALVDDAVVPAVWSMLRGALDDANEMSARDRVCMSLLVPPEVEAMAEARANRQRTQRRHEC